METPRVLIRPAPQYEPPLRVDDVALATLPRPVPRQRPPAPPPATRQALSTATTEARRFAIATVTLVLEVLDRRRTVAQLEPHVTRGLLDQLTILSRSTAPASSASLRRVHIQMGGPGAAEVFGSFERGGRVLAFAARIEQLPCRVRTPPEKRKRTLLPRLVEYRWQLVDFTIA
ncbi:hypothetical protein EEB19_12065 [Gordonia sp. OPL2]|nr:hypothetical protein EEB19_12065 [Gordonia sp. OPL2]